MAAFGHFLADLAWPFHILMLAVSLALVWLLTLPIERLRPYRGQLLVTSGVFYVGLAFFFLTFSFRILPPALVGPTFVQAYAIPRLWFYALIPVAALAITPFITGKADKDLKWGNVRNVAIVLGIIVLSLVLFEFIGYYISSALFIVALMWLLGSRSKIELTVFPVGWILFSYFVFARLLGVRLPVGSVITALMNFAAGLFN